MSTLLRYLQLKFSKPELDTLSTVFGLAATVTTILTTNGYISKQLGTTVAGVSAAVVSLLINNPASISPTTEETEDKLVEDNKE